MEYAIRNNSIKKFIASCDGKRIRYDNAPFSTFTAEKCKEMVKHLSKFGIDNYSIYNKFGNEVDLPDN